MKKGTINDKVLKVVGRIISKEVKRNDFDWPPYCIGILHQPKRPKKKDLHFKA